MNHMGMNLFASHYWFIGYNNNNNNNRSSSQKSAIRVAIVVADEPLMAHERILPRP